ncbi:hypothetical protein EVAR_8645_1 [Eumeta japonica]|uniref:Uncharacterized protein n=1 Tax=Eumeta variegata TaxID=151549 RepID=A0A4C1TUS2_EUMVA|nr:hypothetical protein EVAR_8645_1 [Eumeta japonica]
MSTKESASSAAAKALENRTQFYRERCAAPKNAREIQNWNIRDSKFEPLAWTSAARKYSFRFFYIGSVTAPNCRQKASIKNNGACAAPCCASTTTRAERSRASKASATESPRLSPASQPSLVRIFN